YWCSYGPEDFKEEDALPYDKSKVPTRGTGSRPGRKHIKCGCQCNFNVRILMKRSEYALITYPQMDHVDNNNHICHGQKNHKFEGTRAYYAPHISKELQEWVEKLLLLGMPADIVLQKHREMVHEKLALFDGKTKRDDFLSSHDVQNIDTKIKAAKYMYDRNDAQSVRVWQDQNPNICFEYQEYEGNVEEDGHVPFIMGIQMPQQLEWMLKYGHNNILAMDATFGTNGMKGLFCAPNVACGDEHVVDDPFGQAWNPPNTCEDSMHVLQQDKHVINEEDEHLSPQVRRIRKIVDNSLVGPLNKSFLTLLENTLVETTNRLRGSQISSILGVQHPEAQPFRPVDDGFNNTLHRERDFIEKMLNRRRPCPTNRKASFPIVKKSRVSRRLTWEDELKRAAERDRERGLVEELEDETNTNGI
ncbi:hypothetical protein KI387_032043, partial [Taxus chinensis]